MVKLKKQELLDVINELEKQNEALKNADEYRRMLMPDVLSECQNMAIDLGNYMETLGSYTNDTVHIIEEYCENIYQQSINIKDEKQVRKLAKQVQKQLSLISNKIRYEFPEDKKEIVFLPYKASMWDSLESVWKAADEDENCDAYVVPIPYFDKNPDGTFKQMHYEGNQYPDYVPITSWEEYDISVRKPDAIYIHNPYDDWNIVTSVHPKFYSSELRKHTNMLVYIPYFISVNDVPEHFCKVPAVANAHKVIVQSEKVRDTYIEKFMEWLGEGKSAEEKKRIRKIADDKFLALGSPKTDKLVSTKIEDIKIPKEWEEKINADGKRKKVVLYNTTIDALLKNRDNYLLKLEKVLKEFEENNDVLLMWRPHPLLLSTMDAMLPHLSKRYRQIVADYIRKDKGIYDDSADIDRAIIISDAYYGDWSSVVALYQETGKPIMIQNVEIT